MNDIVLYGSPLSPFLRKAAVMLEEKGESFDVEAVDVFNPPEWFVAISPLRRIPVLRDRSIGNDGPAGTIPDSSAQCAYIERRFPAPALYGDSAYAHGRALWIEEYADTVLAAAGGLGIFRPLAFPGMQGKEPDVAKARATWDDDLPRLYDYLEQELGGRDWLAGNGFSIADIAVAVQLMQITLVAEVDFAARWPSLAAHLERCRARGTFDAVYAKADKFVRRALPQRVVL